MTTNCGRVVIDGYIYTINLEFRDDQGRVQTDIPTGPIDETLDKSKELIIKINGLVTKLKNSLQASQPTKPLSSYKCIQINNAGIQLDGNGLEWLNSSIKGIQSDWSETAQALDGLYDDLKIHPRVTSAALTTTTVEFEVNESISDALASPETPPLTPLDKLVEEFSIKDLGSDAPTKITNIWTGLNEKPTEGLQLNHKTKIAAFLRIADKLAADDEDKKSYRSAVLTKLHELHQTTTLSKPSLLETVVAWIGSSPATSTKTWQPTKENLAELVETLKGQLGNLYDNSNPPPNAAAIDSTPLSF